MVSFLTAQVHHWETVFDQSYAAKYYAGSEVPPSSWKDTSFVEPTTWKTGSVTIGFGNIFNGCPFCVTVPKCTTIYARAKFIIKDTANIESLDLYLDYFDGIVAYINGKEVVRDNLGAPGSETRINQMADTMHFPAGFTQEAYSGFFLTHDSIKQFLKNGENILAVELHNDSIDVDETAFTVFLYAGMKKGKSDYSPSQPNFPYPTGNDSSKLPIVLVNFGEGMIPDADRITATMKIIDSGFINHATDNTFSYEGKITIERRGSASQMFPKHSYGFTTIDELGNDTSVSLLGLPKENDWILKGEFEDRTMLRDVLTFDLARKMGRYAPRAKFCELYLNGINMGLFAIVEKIKRDTFRVDIAKLKDTDNSGRDITGGYILKIDKTTGNSTGGFPVKYIAPLQYSKPFIQYEYPDGNKLTPQQKTYIQDFVYTFEDVLRSENYKDKTTGYRKYISVKSFIDYMISEELARNVDGYRLSAFMYKKKDKEDGTLGQLHMGPLWDFNLAYGYSGSLCGSSWAHDGWGYDYNKDCQGDAFYIPFWWDRLLQDPSFRTELKARWDELRTGPLHTDSIMHAIDNLVSSNRESIDKNNRIWDNVFKTYIWPNDPIANDYDGEITYLKNFITERLSWLDSHIPEIREEVVYTSAPALAVNIGQIKVYPVPFHDEVTFSYFTDEGNDFRLNVFSVTGQMVYSVNGSSVSGQNSLTWNGTDSNGSFIKPGIYMYSLELNNKVVARNKIIKF